MHMFDQGDQLPRRPRDRRRAISRSPPASGFAIRYEDRDRVILCFFGDGSVPQGEFHESMNLAALWKLPVVFVCENNRYAMGTAHPARPRADRHLEVRGGVRDARARPATGWTSSRSGTASGAPWRAPGRATTPTLVEARTYRFRGHSMRDPAAAVYRTKAEVEEEKRAIRSSACASGSAPRAARRGRLAAAGGPGGGARQRRGGLRRRLAGAAGGVADRGRLRVRRGRTRDARRGRRAWR